MPIPQVTFPIEQDKIKSTQETLHKYLLGLAAESRVTQEIMRTVRTFCSHPNSKHSRCPDCGADWSD